MFGPGTWIEVSVPLAARCSPAPSSCAGVWVVGAKWVCCLVSPSLCSFSACCRLMISFNSSMWPWNCLSWSCEAFEEATTFISSFNVGSAAARVASIWITGSVLPFCGAGADVDGDRDGRVLLPDDGGLVGGLVDCAVLAGAAGSG